MVHKHCNGLSSTAGCFKCISSINLSPANKNLLTILLILYNQSKISPNNGTVLDGVLIPKLLNIPFVSLFLMNIDFLLPHFDNNVALLLLVL